MLMLNFYKLVKSLMGHTLELKWDSKLISAMTMTPTAYYQKVHHQINISLLKPHAAFLLTATRESSDGVDLENMTVPVLEDLL